MGAHGMVIVCKRYRYQYRYVCCIYDRDSECLDKRTTRAEPKRNETNRNELGYYFPSLDDGWWMRLGIWWWYDTIRTCFTSLSPELVLLVKWKRKCGFFESFHFRPHKAGLTYTPNTVLHSYLQHLISHYPTYPTLTLELSNSPPLPSPPLKDPPKNPPRTTFRTPRTRAVLVRKTKLLLTAVVSNQCLTHIAKPAATEANPVRRSPPTPAPRTPPHPLPCGPGKGSTICKTSSPAYT